MSIGRRAIKQPISVEHSASLTTGLRVHTIDSKVVRSLPLMMLPINSSSNGQQNDTIIDDVSSNRNQMHHHHHHHHHQHHPSQSYQEIQTSTAFSNSSPVMFYSSPAVPMANMFHPQQQQHQMPTSHYDFYGNYSSSSLSHQNLHQQPAHIYYGKENETNLQNHSIIPSINQTQTSQSSNRQVRFSNDTMFNQHQPSLYSSS